MQCFDEKWKCLVFAIEQCYDSLVINCNSEFVRQLKDDSNFVFGLIGKIIWSEKTHHMIMATRHATGTQQAC